MLISPTLSLRDLLGDEYLDAVIRVEHALTGRPTEELDALASERVDFFPPEFAARSAELACRTGETLIDGYRSPVLGAPTASFGRAQDSAGAPLGGLGVCRIGEDGRIRIAAKSEHYQLSVGHAFPGYDLIRRARELGIPNATHNNTRGHVTRVTERALVAAANGVAPEAADDLIAAGPTHTLTRVVNLETGSLAAEAALKMMLDRFWSAGGTDAPQAGRTPVFLVMGDYDGGISANYHGTTVLAQTLRGLWPEFVGLAAEAGLYRVVPVAINDLDDLREKLARYSTDEYGVAGLCHEIVLMNYGGVLLAPEYLRAAYAACHDVGVPVFCDEIQSGAWYGELFLFRRYGLTPDLVSIGKGFPGGEYPASRVLATAELDTLAQFGALVTNGQEELASLSYLVTMAFVAANGPEIDRVGARYQEGLRGLAAAHPALLAGVDGDGHMGALVFHDPEAAAAFCRILGTEHGIDISAQTYKASAPPVALTKLPVIVDDQVVDVILDRMDRALAALTTGANE